MQNGSFLGAKGIKRNFNCVVRGLLSMDEFWAVISRGVDVCRERAPSAEAPTGDVSTCRDNTVCNMAE